MSDMDQKPQSKAQRARQLTEVWSLAVMFPAAIGVGYLIGYGLDKLLHSYPWCTAIFTAFGAIAAFVNLFRVSGASDDTTPDGRGEGDGGASNSS
jgi:F0F1-type ATP synthase assembly protein I